MKIAVAKEGDHIAQHFGQCEGYVIFIVEDGKIQSRQEIKSPGHAPGVLPQLLADYDADVVIAGGMGPKAIENFCIHGIDVILGVGGSIDEVMERYLKGDLEEGANVCHH